MSRLRALIFDVDGTLADTEECHRRAFNDAFAERGLNWRWSRDEYKKLLKVTGGKERIAHFVRDWLGEAPESIDIKSLHRQKTDRYVAMLESGEVALRPGVSRLFHAALSEGVKLAIATTTSLPNVAALIDHAFGPDMLGKISAISAGDCVPLKKPAPDVYLHALKALDLEPEACIALEDSAPGLRSATAAGLKTIVTINHYTDGQDFDGAISVLESLGDSGSPARRLAGETPPGDMVDLNWLGMLSAM